MLLVEDIRVKRHIRAVNLRPMLGPMPASLALLGKCRPVRSRKIDSAHLRLAGQDLWVRDGAVACGCQSWSDGLGNIPCHPPSQGYPDLAVVVRLTDRHAFKSLGRWTLAFSVFAFLLIVAPLGDTAAFPIPKDQHSCRLVAPDK